MRINYHFLDMIEAYSKATSTYLTSNSYAYTFSVESLRVMHTQHPEMKAHYWFVTSASSMGNVINFNLNAVYTAACKISDNLNPAVYYTQQYTWSYLNKKH